MINKFVLKSKRDRYIVFIQKENTRSKFLNDLSHGEIFDGELFEKINGSEDDLLKTIVKKLEVQDCYVISENKSIDGQRLSIQEALSKAISGYFEVLA